MGAGYHLCGAMWREHSGLWNFRLGSGPDSTCIKPLTTGQKVRLGVMNVPPIESPGKEVVIWLECFN